MKKIEKKAVYIKVIERRTYNNIKKTAFYGGLSDPTSVITSTVTLLIGT